MSRVDDRIRARLHMQIVLRGIAVLLICAGTALCLLWFVGPIVQSLLRGANHSGPSFGSVLQNTSGVVSLGLCLMLPGVLLLLSASWLSEHWVPLRSPRVCPKCAYPRDDMTREKCPNCGERLFAPGTTRERMVQQASGEAAYERQ
jgi:hypothetical protein